MKTYKLNMILSTQTNIEESEILNKLVQFAEDNNYLLGGGLQLVDEGIVDSKYTEDDIREAIDMARMLSHVSCLEDGEHRLKYSNTEDDIIKSLN